MKGNQQKEIGEKKGMAYNYRICLVKKGKGIKFPLIPLLSFDLLMGISQWRKLPLLESMGKHSQLLWCKDHHFLLSVK